MRAYCHEAYETFEREGLEGDDILGILATHPTLVRGEKIIVSIDKDQDNIIWKPNDTRAQVPSPAQSELTWQLAQVFSKGDYSVRNIETVV
jgi:hypothetical protein